jgi:hypothetical protein
MPSYRVTVTVGRLAAGVRPDAVLPAIADAVAELTVLEASAVSLARGVPQVVVRFTAEDDELARQIGGWAVAAAERRAEVDDARLTRRSGTAWRTVPWGAE